MWFDCVVYYVWYCLIAHYLPNVLNDCVYDIEWFWIMWNMLSVLCTTLCGCLYYSANGWNNSFNVFDWLCVWIVYDVASCVCVFLHGLFVLRDVDDCSWLCACCCLILNYFVYVCFAWFTLFCMIWLFWYTIGFVALFVWSVTCVYVFDWSRLTCLIVWKVVFDFCMILNYLNWKMFAWLCMTFKWCVPWFVCVLQILNKFACFCVWLFLYLCKLCLIWFEWLCMIRTKFCTFICLRSFVFLFCLYGNDCLHDL